MPTSQRKPMFSYIVGIFQWWHTSKSPLCPHYLGTVSMPTTFSVLTFFKSQVSQEILGELPSVGRAPFPFEFRGHIISDAARSAVNHLIHIIYIIYIHILNCIGYIGIRSNIFYGEHASKTRADQYWSFSACPGNQDLDTSLPQETTTVASRAHHLHPAPMHSPNTQVSSRWLAPLATRAPRHFW